MKKSLFLFALGLATVMPAKAQWTNWNTTSAISGVFGVLNHSIESAERKKAMEIQAREKIEYEQTFKDAMESARDYEGGEYWDDALTKYEEAAKLNCKYGYTDQMQITRKINHLARLFSLSLCTREPCVCEQEGHEYQDCTRSLLQHGDAP